MEKITDRKGQNRGRDLLHGGRDLETLPFRPSETRRSQADFAVAIHESQRRTSSGSICALTVFCLGKLSISPRLLPHEVRILSPLDRDRDLRLPGRDLWTIFAGMVLGRDLQLQAVFFSLLPHLLHL
ncbi:unnamed protein product [Linum trigynum]|uniref:Uncharacterized protein n=1 Tax=Linum trigynum TaxID=586398 RepID=A0AAV2EVY8_9ROSI